MKKLKFVVLSMTMVLGLNMVMPVLAKSTPKIPSVKEQQAQFKKFANSKESIPTPDKGESTLTRASITGKYPSRKGTIVVTDASNKDISLAGHAAIVLSEDETVESNPKDGVQKKKNDFNKRYKTAWGITARKTTIKQDKAAANWAIKQIGKPYNKNYTNVETTKKFYCSQLVYKAFKVKTKGKVIIRNGPFFVSPADLVNSDTTKTIYTYNR